MIDRCYIGDVRDGLREFIAQGVRAQVCVTSPPYWGLRDYGTAQWDGGDTACDHRKVSDAVGAVATSTLGGGKKTTGHLQEGFGQSCGKCGARRIDQQLGLEPTIAEYVANMVDVFRLVRDALADDGTLWLNLGDSYAGSASGAGPSPTSCLGSGPGGVSKQRDDVSYARRERAAGLKPKDLCGIPWRVAFALQDDGWYLRSDIIWHKPNPMPESIQDRPTKSHEYLFLLSKRASYYYDAKAIAEPADTANTGRTLSFYANRAIAMGVRASGNEALPINDQPIRATTRNKRTVWTIASEPYADAHFATFPTALVEPCILAGTSERGHCPKCGAGWRRVIERSKFSQQSIATKSQQPGMMRNDGNRNLGGLVFAKFKEANPDRFVGWEPGCACGITETVPGVVLDPFMGSGTTAQVAQSLGRRWIGCELNESYAAMQTQRAAQLGMQFA